MQAVRKENEMTEETFPQKGNSGSGTTPCYSVQARYVADEPKQIGEVIYHKDWKTLRFESSKVGVPQGICDPYCQAARMGLLSYAAAQALRWWFHASVDPHGGLCFETRILKHIVEDSYSEMVVGAYEEVADMGAIMPKEKEK